MCQEVTFEHCMLQDELGLDNQAKRDAMFSLPREKKWTIYCNHKVVM